MATHFGPVNSDVELPAALAHAFVAFAGGSSMDGRSFVKCLRDAGLLDADFTTTNADLVFTKSRVLRGKQLERYEQEPRGICTIRGQGGAGKNSVKRTASRFMKERKLDVIAFRNALRMVAQQKGLGLEAVEELVAEVQGPVYCSQRSGSPLRMTRQDSRGLGPERFYYDKSTYTGVHKNGGPTLWGSGTERTGGYADLSELVDRDHVQDDMLQRRRKSKEPPACVAAALPSHGCSHAVRSEGTVRPKPPAIAELDECPSDLPWMSRLQNSSDAQPAAEAGGFGLLDSLADRESMEASGMSSRAPSKVPGPADVVDLEYDADASEYIEVSCIIREAKPEETPQLPQPVCPPAALVRPAAPTGIVPPVPPLALPRSVLSQPDAAFFAQLDAQAFQPSSQRGVPAWSFQPPARVIRSSSISAPVADSSGPGVATAAKTVTPALHLSATAPVLLGGAQPPPVVAQRARLPVLLGSFQQRRARGDANAWTGAYKQAETVFKPVVRQSSVQLQRSGSSFGQSWGVDTHGVF